ncbi:DNA cytosine methyltransferase [Clostridium chromiireducens]|uniref:DNA (cytosine-5-)-methyltransferase n=1 Tax=Clostridium chromiireducens TaxID=225345 RepID=A0A399IQI4_9CLOT|nr:DNA cytosine methyltransferase [Clostridium chromiireducens]RII35261.1 DNA cytosine methyltransferase [Clostridium chromiireducens]
MNKIPIVSFFSGAGFLDLGFELENFDVMWSNEISKDFSEIYRVGMSAVLQKEMKVISNDSIADLNLRDLKRQFKSSWLDDNTIWGIIGGPPCPDFSVAGNQLGEKGKNGILSSVYVDTIIYLQPTFFVFENVKGLITTKKHREYFLTLKAKLEMSGYIVDFKVLNALDYGVPQDRERVILIGIEQDFFKNNSRLNEKDKWFPWLEGVKYENAKGKFLWPDKNKFGDFIQKPKDIPNELMVDWCLTFDDKKSKVENIEEYFKPKSKKFHEIDEGDTCRKSFKRLHRYRFSPTVAYGNNEVHLHPTLPRRLSIREALRIQSVPDEYIMPHKMPLTIKFKAIGNGVPVQMSRAIAKALNKILERK